GCGKMGGALLAGWLDRGADPASLAVVEPQPDAGRALAARHGIRVVAAHDELDPGFAPSAIVFAVKPQALGEVAPPYRRFAGGATVFLSIAAGKPVAFFSAALGADAAIVRTMPNPPAAVGRGITAAFANPNAGPD